MEKEIEKDLCLLIEMSEGAELQEALAKIEGYILGLLEALKIKK